MFQGKFCDTSWLPPYDGSSRYQGSNSLCKPGKGGFARLAQTGRIQESGKLP
jgi:hypothetical protein